MQKIKNPILCWLVLIAVMFRPSPAQAAIPLAVVAVGAVIAASGVMVAGAGVYKPPTFAQANAAVSSATGDITRKVVVAKAFADGVSSGMRGYQGQYVLDFNKAYSWVKDHTSSYPLLAPSFGKSMAPAVGSVLNDDPLHPNPLNWQITGLGTYIYDSYGGDLASKGDCAAFFAAQCASGITLRCLGTHYATYAPYAPTEEVFNPHVDANGVCRLSFQGINTSVLTSNPVSFPVPGLLSPSAFAAAYPLTQAGQDETDKICADNPPAVKSAPAPFTAEQVAQAQAATKADISAAASTTAAAAAAANPTDTNLHVAASQAATIAAQDKANAIAEQVNVETKAEEPEKVDTPPASLSPPAAHVALDFSPLYALSGQASGHYPFNILSSVASYFSCLVADPQPPSFTMPTVFGKTCTFDLAAWSPSASVMRGAMLFFFNILCMVAIVRRWS